MESLRKHQSALLLAGTVAFFLILFLLLVNRDMRQEWDHDENYFVAGGVLAGDSLIPYKDYHYTQTPYLAFIYGAIFKHTHYLLLSARALSTICEFAALGLVFYIAFKLFRGWHNLIRFCVAASAATLLFTNPLFTYTSGHAWNHAVPELATLVAFVLQCRGVREPGGAAWVFISGMLLGFAAGVRVTYAVAILPLASLIFLPIDGVATRTRARMLLSFAAGVGLAMLPAFLLLALYPRRFIFDVIGYFRFDAITLPLAQATYMKLTYFTTTVLRDPGNLVLYFSFVLSVLLIRPADVRAKMREHVELIAILLLAPLLFIGSFVKPLPLYRQYFYAPIPFLVLGLLSMIASIGAQDVRTKWVLQLAALAVLVSTAYGLPEYRQVGHLWSLDKWVPIRVHGIGTEIGRAVDKGTILTLAPIYPLEAGAKIYCEFSEEPFMWRTGDLVPAAERSDLGVISPGDLNKLLKSEAPDAVLVGFEGGLELPLVTYAKANGYKPRRLSNGADLWVPSTGGVKKQTAHGLTQVSGGQAPRVAAGLRLQSAHRCTPLAR